MRRHRSSDLDLALVLALALALVAALLAGCATPPSPAPPPAGHGAVASAAPAATEVGLALLREGGNAVDAAVGTALALAVVHPIAGNLGGGGFAVVRVNGALAALDFRETAPARATHDMFLGPDGAPVPGASLIGPLAAGVPGSPAGYFELHRRYGKLPWERVVTPAVALARDGFVVTDRLAAEIADERERLARFPETAAVWLPRSAPPTSGSRVVLPRLAATLQAYAAKGPAAITEGPLAAAIEAASARHGGILTAADLAAYRPEWREPVRFTAFGWEFASMPLPSSGGIILGQTFGLLERLGWSNVPRADEAQRAHLLAETWRRAYGDRVLLGDPASSSASAAQLLDPAWLDRRAQSIDRTLATPSDGVPPWPGESTETTHLSVVDAAGNAVALTTTLNDAFGCGLLVPEAGFLLNDEMDDFATAPGRPNLYGLVQGEANAVAPGRRMLSSMSPTVAWRGGDVLAVGSPGGSRIPTATAQVLLNVIIDGRPLADAVSRPRIHHQGRPDELVHERGALADETGRALQQLGHVLRRVKKIGEVAAARRLPDGTLQSAGDPRGPGSAGVM